MQCWLTWMFSSLWTGLEIFPSKDSQRLALRRSSLFLPEMKSPKESLDFCFCRPTFLLLILSQAGCASLHTLLLLEMQLYVVIINFPQWVTLWLYAIELFKWIFYFMGSILWELSVLLQHSHSPQPFLLLWMPPICIDLFWNVSGHTCTCLLIPEAQVLSAIAFLVELCHLHLRSVLEPNTLYTVSQACEFIVSDLPKIFKLNTVT